jgi:N-acetyl-beta-hexosaminidase
MMFQEDPNVKLLKIFKLALQNENVDLRDSVIGYLAQTELIGGAQLISDYLDSERLEWLKEYANNVLKHLQMREAGQDSRPPTRPSFEEVIDLPGVKKLMARERLQNNMDLEHYFNRRMANVITDLGRVTAGWDEVASAGLDKQHTLVMWWRQDKSSALKDAFAKGFNVVLCPRTPLYFDFVQDETHTSGRKIREIDEKKGIYHLSNSLDTVYAFPASHLKLVDSQVAGIQANLWTETVVTEKRLDFMTYPRLQALAESAWTQAENKNYEQFLERLKVHLPYMENMGIYFFNPFDKLHHPEPKK